MASSEDATRIVVLEGRVEDLEAIVRVLVAANETRDGAVGLVWEELGDDAASLLAEILDS